jgi:bifunctional non-homologous end joining protein LigD
MNLQLLTDCESAEAAEAHFISPLWCAEEKLDGDWRRIIKHGNTIVALTREGREVSASAETIALAMLCPHDFVLDGEQMPLGRFVAFDIFGLSGHPVNADNAARREILCSVWAGDVVTRAVGEQAKRDLCDAVKAAGGEGLVFKRVDAPYIEGRSQYCQRWKNYHIEAFDVMAVDIEKCSIEVASGGVSFGKVPCSLNRLPRVGEMVLIKFECVTEKGKLLRGKLAK